MPLARLGWRAPFAALLLGLASPGALRAEEPASVEEEAPLEGEAKKQHAQDVSKFDKRYKAIEALGYVKDDRSFTLLLDTLTKDKNPLLREGAAKGLKHAGRQEAVAALKAAVANESAQPVRGAAIDTLKALGATAD